MKRFALTILYEAPDSVKADEAEKARLLASIQAFVMTTGYNLKLVQLETVGSDDGGTSARWTP